MKFEINKGKFGCEGNYKELNNEDVQERINTYKKFKDLTKTFPNVFKIEFQHANRVYLKEYKRFSERMEWVTVDSLPPWYPNK